MSEHQTREAGAKTEGMWRLCRAITDRSPMALAATEGITHIVRYVNSAFCALAERPMEELIGLPYAEAVREGDANGFISLLDRVYRTGKTEMLADQEHSHVDLPSVYWSYVAWAIRLPEGQMPRVMIQVTDTTENVLFRRQVTALNQELMLSSVRQHELTQAAEEMNTYLRTLATTDGLTGLKNHRAFQERLKEEVARSARYAAPMSLLLIDVDRFKDYNDAYGHPAGDEVLRKIGQVLQSMARTNDLVSRYGGEEFAIILTETNLESAVAAAERFRAAVETVSWPERNLTVSIGATTLAPDVPNPSALIEQADIALYRSKERGRNCITHHADVPPAGMDE